MRPTERLCALTLHGVTQVVAAVAVLVVVLIVSGC